MEKDAFGRPLSQDPGLSNSTGRNTGIASGAAPRVGTIRVGVGVDADGGFLRLGLDDPLRVPLRADLAGTVRDLMNRGGDTDVVDHLIEALTNPVLAEEEAMLAALRPCLWMLQRAGEGLPLTAAGYLKPVDVTTLSDILPTARDWFGKKNREDQTTPVWQFRRMMMRYRLIRKYKGSLLLTANGKHALADPAWLWHWLSWQVLQAEKGSASFDAVVIDLIFTAAGYRASTDFLARMVTIMGWEHTDGTPLDDWSVRRLMDSYASVITNLGDDPYITVRSPAVSAVERTFALNAITLSAPPELPGT